MISDALKAVRRRLVDGTRSKDARIPELEAQAKTLRVVVDKLVAALASASTKPDAIVMAIADRQEKASALRRTAAIYSGRLKTSLFA
ncbi:MAG: hypothetical protein ABI551_22300 [Polyangiaceae bacterium]